MNRKVWVNFFRVFGAVVLVAALLSPGLFGDPIKIGTDSSSTHYAYTGSEYIRISGSSKVYNTTQSDLQLAIWDLNTTGGDVWLPPCNISLTSSISLTSNITIHGVGHDSTIYTGSDIDMFTFTGNVFPDDWGFTLDGLRFCSTSTHHTSKAAVKVDRCHRAKVTNCFFENVYDG
jgi:hypothetical protein